MIKIRKDIITPLLLNKINKIKKLGISDFSNFEIETVLIDSDYKLIEFSNRFNIILPHSTVPYVYIYNQEEIFFMFSFLDVGRKNFDLFNQNFNIFYKQLKIIFNRFLTNKNKNMV